jgi:hypothetical protein
VILKRYNEGGARFSIRQRQDGSFQAYHDNPYEGVNQPYRLDDEPISGLFGDVASAEAELFRHPRYRAEIKSEAPREADSGP